MKKTETGTCLIFLGIELDTVAMQARLPEDKLSRLKADLIKMGSNKTVSVREVQSLAGSLNFACSVVAPGRPFIRRIYQTTWGLKSNQPDFRVKVSAGMKDDLKVWLTFLEQYNGVTMFLPNDPVLDYDLGVFVASSLTGFGVVCGAKWVSQRWPKGWKEASPLTKHLYPVMVLVHMFGEVLANKRLLLHLPVFGQVKALNRLSTKDPQAMQVIRDLVLKMLVYNVQLVVVRAAHSVNPAIFVAQGDERAFATLMGYSDQQPTLILDYLCPEIYMDSWM